jgi:hypothetical protein
MNLPAKANPEPDQHQRNQPKPFQGTTAVIGDADTASKEPTKTDPADTETERAAQ